MKNIRFISLPQRLLALLLLILCMIASHIGFGQATLPIAVFTGGKGALPTGFTHTGLGSDYASAATKLKFDDQGDQLVIFFTGTPGTLTYSVMGNPASGSAVSGTFIVEESSDGATYTDVNTLVNKSNSTTSYSHTLLGNSKYVRFRFAVKSGGNIGLGTISLTVGVSCPTPTMLAFDVQPSNVIQNLNMAAVKVKAVCASGIIATSYTGNVTLTLNTPGCGYTTQTVAAVAGVATFSNVVLLRSPQNNLRFTASASSLTSVISNAFNVNVPPGTPTTSILTQNTFSSPTNTWNYTIGTGTHANDVTGIKTFSSNNVLSKSSSTDNTGSTGRSTNTVTFDNMTGLSSYDQVIFEFQIASLGSGSGAGNDSGEDAIIQVSTNGGSSWTTILTEEGGNDRLFGLSATPITDLSLSNASYSSGSNSSFRLTLTGISQFQFRFTAANNRSNENWVIDNVKLSGKVVSIGQAFNLPSVDAGDDVEICNNSGAQLSASVTSFQAPLTYLWSPAATLNNASSQHPIANPNSLSQIYTVSITDGHNCKASSSVTVSNPGFGGTPGLWTGAESTNWFDCRNWSDHKVPTASTNVTINQTASNECIIDEFDAVCNSLTIASNNGVHPDLTIQTSGTLTVSNAITINKIAGSGSSELILLDEAQLVCGNLTIDGYNTSNARLNHKLYTTSVTVNGNLTIEIGGELDMSDGNDITLDGSINLKGNFTNNAGESEFQQGQSTIILNGTANQSISIVGAETETFYNLSVDKTTGTVLLFSDIQVQKQLDMSSGNINTQSSTLELGESIDEKGILAHTSGFVLGKMRRWFDGTNSGNANSLFPMGFNQGGLQNRNVSVEYNTAPSNGGYLTVEFIASDMGMSGIPILATSTGTGFDVTSTENLGYWKIDNETGKLTDGQYKITCTGEGFGTINDLSKLTLLKRIAAAGPEWFCPGTHVAPSGSTSMPVLSRSAVSGWSNFGFGGGTINPLPVELISFTASCGNQKTLRWSTASENNAAYFSVQKNTNGIHWTEIGKVEAAGNTSHLTNYVFEDPTRENSIVYYRLVQVDFNGNSKSYNPLSMDCIHNSLEINLYPNPNNGQFSVELNTSDLSGQISILLLSADGKIIERKELNPVHDTAAWIEFNQTDLQTGFYFLTVFDQDKISKTIRMIVE